VPVGTAIITGIVTAADTGRPIRGVRVSLNGATGPLSPMGTGGPGVASTSGRGAGQGPVTNAPPASRAAVTDAQGGFVFEHLPAGHYSLSASRATYLTTNYGQKRPTGQGATVPLGDGQKLTLNLQLLRGGVISGTVLGDDGEPAAQTQVQVWRLNSNNGVKRLQRANGASTDDRGAYRISNLQPGDYLVSATAGNSDAMMVERMLADTALIQQAVTSGAIQPASAPGFPATVSIPVQQQPQNQGVLNQPPGFAPVFHPGTIEPRNATMVRVVGGDEHRFIDIPIRLAPATNIVGSITNLPGQDLGVQVVLMNEDLFVDSTNTTRADANGQYVFRNVAPGKYTLHADVVPAPSVTVNNGVQVVRTGPPPPLEDSQKLWGRDSVTVDGQGVVTSSITLRPGRSISGTVVFDMERPPDLTRSRVTVTLSPAADTPQMRFSPFPQAAIGPDGRFTLNAVGPGRYQIRASSGWARSAVVDGRDTLDFPFDFTGEADLTNATITVTDRTTEITGTLTDVTGQPGQDFTVIAVATDEKYWTPGSRRISYTRTRADGQYRFGNLPGGTYFLAVVTDLEFGAQYDPEFLKAVAAAATTRVTLGEGEKVVRDLRVMR
jgi:uncharacterized protein (DUF2141 family)